MKKRKISTKIIFSMLFVLIVFISLSIANSFYGNPISKSVAAKKINDYIINNYNGIDYIIEEPKYNFKFSEYYSNVYSKKDIDVHFFVKYRNKKIYDDYDIDVLSGWNTKRRMEDEYATLLTPLLKEEFAGSFNRVTIEYAKEINKASIETMFNKPLNTNDGEYKKLWLNLKDMDMTVESLSSNLKILHNKLTEKSYYIDEYVLWIDGDGEYDYINVTGIKPNMIDAGLTELIQYSKDNREEAFRKYGINSHFKTEL